MQYKRFSYVRSIVLVCIIIMLTIGCAEKPDAKEFGGLRQVSASKVCMINNEVFDKTQIPVEVEGKTYYGCCEMCEEKLQNDEGARFAYDPVSKNRVDKASALIGADSAGKVFYFESEQTFKRYGQN